MQLILRWWRRLLRRPAPTRVRTPTILQMEAVECGAAALGIILACHGRRVSLEELRVACGVSRDGSKAISIVKAARTYGMSARGARLEIGQLRQQKFPAILFWNFNHFLVIEGFGRDVVYLNDPATGPRGVTPEEFSKAYTGVTLLFEPAAGFEPGGVRPNLIKALAQRLRQARLALLFVILVSLALVIPGLIIPIFSQVFVDSYLIGQMDGWVKPLLLGMAATTVVRGMLTWLQQKYLLRLELHLSLTGSARFFWHVLRLPMEFFSQRYAGDISQRVEANDRIANLLSGELATNAVNVLMLIFYLAVMTLYNWKLTLIGAALTALNLVALKAIARIRSDGNMLLLQDRGKLMATLIGGIQTVETIKASGAEDDFFSRWAGYKAKVNNTEQKLEFYTRVLSALPGLLSALNNVAILGIGGAEVIEGNMSVGMLVAFQSLMISVTLPVTRLMMLAGKYQEAKGDMARLDDVMRYAVEPAFAPASAQTSAPTLAATSAPTDGEVPPRTKLQGIVELCDISFGYSRLEPPLITDFNLTLKPGQRIALVGGSGSGKS